MRKYFIVFLLFFAVGAILFWTYAEIPKSSVMTINNSIDEVKVGMNLELTGLSDYFYGEEVEKGALLAFEEINQDGGVNGVKIIPLIVDNRADPVRAAFLSNKLEQEGVVSVIGPTISDVFITTIPVAMKNKIPNVVATASADELTVDTRSGKPHDYVFRVNYNISLQSEQMAKFALETLGAKKVVVIRNLYNAYSNGLAENFMRVFIKGGGNVIDLINYTSGETDFTSILNRIQGKNFDIIYMPGYDVEAAYFIKQARELGITQPILGGDAYDTPKLFEIAGPSALNNVYYNTDFVPSNQSPRIQSFIAAYKEKYGSEPFVDNARGYDSAYFIANAIKEAGSCNPQAIRDAMASTENFEGVTGTFRMDEDHNPIKVIYIIGLENGIPTQIIPVEPTKL